VKDSKGTETNIYRLGVWAQDLEAGSARLQKQKSCVLAYCENLQKLRAVLKCLPEWILTGECKVEINILNAQRPALWDAMLQLDPVRAQDLWRTVRFAAMEQHQSGY
jgi:hypothetical protein